jgi:hypothetical protein
VHNAQKFLGTRIGRKLFYDNHLQQTSVMHFMHGVHNHAPCPPSNVRQQVPPRGPVAELLSTELPMIEWAQAGAVAVETIVHISGLAVKRPRRISVAMIFTRRTGAFRQLLRPHNLLWN